MADITLSTVAGTTLGGSFSNMPAGVIVMWSGSIATIPGGFFLCDGTNGTPDLRNRFIIGANSDTSSVAYATVEGSNTKSGGTKDAVVVTHNHTITQTPHSHTVPIGQSSGSTSFISGSGNFGSVGTSSVNANITIDNAGVSGTNQNLPPYYALAYIMKG